MAKLIGHRSRPRRILAALLPACLLCGPAAAQELTDDEELLTPPVIESRPGETHLEPPPEDRDDILEAVVTGAQDSWRLPDFGTSFLDEEQPREPDERIELGFVPLYDPEKPQTDDTAFRQFQGLEDVGFIRLIELRFGKRTLESESER